MWGNQMGKVKVEEEDIGAVVVCEENNKDRGEHEIVFGHLINNHYDIATYTWA